MSDQPYPIPRHNPECEEDQPTPPSAPDDLREQIRVRTLNPGELTDAVMDLLRRNEPRVVRVRYTATCNEWGEPVEVVGPFPDEEAAHEFCERMNDRAEEAGYRSIAWLVDTITPPEHFKDYVDG